MQSTKGMNTNQVIAAAIIIAIVAFASGWVVKPIPQPTPSPGFATIKGKVTDSETGEAVSGAFIISNGYGIVTGAAGTYSLEVGVGEYDLSISMAGYETKTISVSASEEQDYTVDTSIKLISVEEPKVPSRLVSGVKWDTDTFDPHFAVTSPSVYYSQHIFEGLTVSLDFNCLVAPSLAKYWTTPDDTTYIFHLRKGVQFHDGTPFNAEAVKYSIDRILDPDVGAALAGRYTILIDSTEVIDDYTIKINIKMPYIGFTFDLAALKIVSPTADRKWGEDIAMHPTGTGPFKFSEWVPGDHTLYIANDDYWAGRPHIDELLVRVIPEDTVRLVELETGGIDVTQIDLYEDAARLREDPGYKVGKSPNFSTRFFVFNIYSPPFDDVRVRQAIAYALNPKDIVDSIYYGFAEVSFGLVPTFSPWYNPDLPEYYHDKAKARELLAEADAEDLEFTLLVANYGRWADEAVIFQAQLLEVGIVMNIEVLEFAAAKEKWLALDFEAHFNGGGGPTPGTHIKNCYTSTSYYNYGQINNTKIDDLYYESQLTSDVAEQARIYDEIIVELYDQCYQAYVYVRSPANVWSSKVKGFYGEHFFTPDIVNGGLGINVWIEES